MGSPAFLLSLFVSIERLRQVPQYCWQHALLLVWVITALSQHPKHCSGVCLTWGLYNHHHREKSSQSRILSVGEWEGLQPFLLVPSVLILSSAFAFFHHFSPAFFPCKWEDRPSDAVL